MDYDEDDLYDEEADNAGFSEDQLNDEEYDKLYEALPKLKQQTDGKFKGLDDVKLKELLWNNYFSVDDTLDQIRQEYKRKYGSGGVLSHVGPEEPVGRQSKLKLLAKKNAEGGGLSALMKRRGEKKGLSALEQRMKKRRLGEQVEPLPQSEKPKSKLKGLAGLRKKPLRVKEVPSAPVSAQPSLPQMPSSVSFQKLTSTPISLLTRIIFSDSTDKPTTTTTLFDFFTNNPAAARKSAQNFSQPSPDDRQRKLDELTAQVAKVKIAPKKPAGKKKIANLDAELDKKAAKPLLAFVVIGHVDSGKSTMVGRMLYDLKIVDSKTMHRLTRESETIGKASFSLAWIMDQTDEERSRGVTVDICQTQFETPTSKFTAIDSPGHKDYVPQMINGVTQADIAVVIIDAASFESGFSNNGQTREHLMIAKSLGIERCVIAVNKMDAIQWDQEKFKFIQDQLTEYLVEELAYDVANLTFIPTSGYDGDNVVNKSTHCSWYTGATLMEDLEYESRHHDYVFNKDSRFIMTVNDLQVGKSDELLLSGRIASGMIGQGQSVVISPSGETGTIDSISTTVSNVGSSAVKKQPQKVAIEGEFVELRLRKLDNPENVRVGDIATKVGDEIPPSKKFKCSVSCFELDRPLLVGTPFILFRGNISLPARLAKIYEIESHGKVKKRKHLASNNKGLVDIEIRERPVPMLSFAQNEKLGRIVLRRDGKTIGAGKIDSTDE